MDVLAYLRVSTDEQGRSGLGVAAQRSAIEREADRRGWTVVEWVADDGYSGKSLNRPGIVRCLEMLENGGPDVLVVAKLDRLSRSLIDFASVTDRARQRGWVLIVIEPNFDMTTAEGRLFANIMASFAEYERELIGQRTKAALESAKRRGQRLGRPRSLPGAVVEDICRQHKAGASLRAIANSLNKWSVPTAQGGRQWYASTVASVLRSVELDNAGTPG